MREVEDLAFAGFDALFDGEIYVFVGVYEVVRFAEGRDCARYRREAVGVDDGLFDLEEVR